MENKQFMIINLNLFLLRHKDQMVCSWLRDGFTSFISKLKMKHLDD